MYGSPGKGRNGGRIPTPSLLLGVITIAYPRVRRFAGDLQTFMGCFRLEWMAVYPRP